VAALRCAAASHSEGKIVAALEYAREKLGSDVLSADIVLVLERTGLGYHDSALFLRGVLVPELSLEQSQTDLARVEFQDSVFGSLSVSADFPIDHTPRFVRCHFGLVEGFTGLRDLPTKVFLDVTADDFDNPAHTTNAILSLALPLATRVLLTVVRKLYAQRGSGRRESALYRGLDARAQQLVPEVLDLLRREGFAIRSRQGDQPVWLPARSSDARRRALSILAAPNASTDPLVGHSRNLGGGG
jgi:hypothetical protein